MPPAPDKSFPRRERLKSKKRIARLFEQGKSGFVYPVRYVLLDDSAEESVDGKARSVAGRRALGLLYASGDVAGYSQIESAVKKIIRILREQA